jgi:hypothetical protein
MKDRGKNLRYRIPVSQESTTSPVVGTVMVLDVHRMAAVSLAVTVQVPVEMRAENPVPATAFATTRFCELRAKVTVPAVDGLVQF